MTSFTCETSYRSWVVTTGATPLMGEGAQLVGAEGGGGGAG
jgi:hypothetical protein